MGTPNNWAQLPTQAELSEREKLLLQLRGGVPAPVREPARAVVPGSKEDLILKTFGGATPQQPQISAQTDYEANKAEAEARTLTPPTIQMPQRFAKDSGMSDTEKGRNEFNSKGAETRLLRMTPGEVKTDLSALSALPMFKDQAAGINQLQGMLSMGMDAPVQTDLSSLAGVADYLAKGKGTALAAYQKPESGAARLDKAKAYAAKIQDDKKDLNKTILDAFGKMKAGTSLDAFTANSLLERIVAAKDPSMAAGKGRNQAPLNADRFVKTFRSDPTVKPALEALNAAKQIVLTEGRNDWLTDRNIQNALIKAAHVSPVSDRDVARLSNEPGLVGSYRALEAKLIEGRALSAADKAVAISYGKFQLEKSKSILEDAGNDYADKMGPEYGYDKSRAVGLIKPTKGWTDTGMGPTGAVKASTTPRTLTPAEQAELQALRKKAGQ